MKLSIIVPVYNEKKTIQDVMKLLLNLEFDKEIIVVDDFSEDGTREILNENYENAGIKDLKILYHDGNKGKGAAIRTAIPNCGGDYIAVQDADMEYSPEELKKLLDYAEHSGCEAIFGSRFLETWRSTSFLHYTVNWFLTFLTNILFGSRLTDMETCYKMVKADILKNMDIKAMGFEFEPEVTAKLLKNKIKIHEVPISYRGRGYDEGKKITWKDGIMSVAALFKLRFS